jgi:hypothetical protein
MGETSSFRKLIVHRNRIEAVSLQLSVISFQQSVLGLQNPVCLILGIWQLMLSYRWCHISTLVLIKSTGFCHYSLSLSLVMLSEANASRGGLSDVVIPAQAGIQEICIDSVSKLVP